MNVFVSDEQDVDVNPTALIAMAERVMAAESVPNDAQISIVLVDEAASEEYNRRFMTREGPTDVLAFPVEELHPGRIPARPPNSPPLNLGDIFICPSVVTRQAQDLGVTLTSELALIVTHGILHLLGWHHDTEEGASAMAERERELMRGAGFDRV